MMTTANLSKVCGDARAAQHSSGHWGLNDSGHLAGGDVVLEICFRRHDSCLNDALRSGAGSLSRRRRNGLELSAGVGQVHRRRTTAQNAKNDMRVQPKREAWRQSSRSKAAFNIMCPGNAEPTR